MAPSPERANAERGPTFAPADVLVVDDEHDVQGLVTWSLREAGFDVLAVGCGRDALTGARDHRPTAVVLDWMLPDMNGLDVCRSLRTDRALEDTSVLMLTARGAEEDRLDGFRAGVDDYLVKPFSPRELVLRVRLLVRLALDRGHARTKAQGGECIVRGRLEVRVDEHVVLRDGEEIALRPLEYEVLLALLRTPGKTFSRAELLEAAWGTSEGQLRAVDTQVRRLREKLGEASTVIETVHGHGYRLRTP